MLCDEGRTTWLENFNNGKYEKNQKKKKSVIVVVLIDAWLNKYGLGKFIDFL